MNRLLLLAFGALSSFSVSPEHANQIAEKIWRNECGGKEEALTHWNKGEDFPSFGIGHFIWYPKGKRSRFQETFPNLVKFLRKEGIEVPSWLEKECPWNSREDFYREMQNSRMVFLRKLLLDTKNLQAVFIAKRLEKTIAKMGKECEQIAVRLAEDPRGLYALIDYLNFKGSGMSLAESFKGRGWGLRQVLLRMSASKNRVADFVEAAKSVLTERVANSPPERHEERWLPGWLNRVSTYLEEK